MKFTFRLEILLTARKARERAVKQELEHLLQKHNQAKEKEKTLQTQIEALKVDMQQKQQEGKLLLQETYYQILDHLQGCLVTTEQSIQAHCRQIAEQKERLKQAVKERKVIEKIKEKHYACAP